MFHRQSLRSDPDKVTTWFRFPHSFIKFSHHLHFLLISFPGVPFSCLLAQSIMLVLHSVQSLTTWLRSRATRHLKPAYQLVFDLCCRQSSVSSEGFSKLQPQFLLRHLPLPTRNAVKPKWGWGVSWWILMLATLSCCGQQVSFSHIYIHIYKVQIMHFNMSIQTGLLMFVFPHHHANRYRRNQFNATRKGILL